MLIKITRQDCLNKYKVLPLHSYDYKRDEDFFSYPKVFKSYILTIPSKSFKGHAREFAKQLSKLVKQLKYHDLVFMGDTTTPWLYQDNEYKPVKEALQYLTGNKVGKRFNGALEIENAELVTFIKHLSWLIRCNASLPYFHFTDKGQQLIGSICKYGNLHIDTLNAAADNNLKKAIQHTGFKYLEGNSCYNQFGRTSKIAERKIVIP